MIDKFSVLSVCINIYIQSISNDIFSDTLLQFYLISTGNNNNKKIHIYRQFFGKSTLWKFQGVSEAIFWWKGRFFKTYFVKLCFGGNWKLWNCFELFEHDSETINESYAKFHHKNIFWWPSHMGVRTQCWRSKIVIRESGCSPPSHPFNIFPSRGLRSRRSGSAKICF